MVNRSRVCQRKVPVYTWLVVIEEEDYLRVVLR